MKLQQNENSDGLKELFYNNQGRLIHKWTSYFPVYERYFEQYKNRPVTILEIGVFHGGSLQMWKKYFGKKAIIYGLDIDPRCKSLEEENVKIFIGSQSDRKYLKWLKTQIPKVDIILDDGGHTMKQQRVSFEELIDHVKDDGIYMCEDCHTSYWPSFGGGYLRKGTFIEYSKKLIDYLNAWHTKQLTVNSFTQSVRSISFYDSIVVFEKMPMEKPQSIMTGTPSFIMGETKKNSLGRKFYLKGCRYCETILAFLKLPSPSRK
ncbi:hypothetical protein Barb6_01159 [Bacteroidales bacterium Barb6]|nr:hypothetical protein Barb6_01159 [Bacteroidales bacterium Barb6]